MSETKTFQLADLDILPKYINYQKQIEFNRSMLADILTILSDGTTNTLLDKKKIELEHIDYIGGVYKCPETKLITLKIQDDSQYHAKECPECGHQFKINHDYSEGTCLSCNYTCLHNNYTKDKEKPYICGICSHTCLTHIMPLSIDDKYKSKCAKCHAECNEHTFTTTSVNNLSYYECSNCHFQCDNHKIENNSDYNGCTTCGVTCSNHELTFLDLNTKLHYCKNKYDKYVCQLPSLDLLTSLIQITWTDDNNNYNICCELKCLECGGKCENHHIKETNQSCESCGFTCTKHEIKKNNNIFTCKNCKYICTNHKIKSNVENNESAYLKYFTCNTCGIVCKIDGEGDDLIHKMEYDDEEEIKCKNCGKKHDILPENHPITILSLNKKISITCNLCGELNNTVDIYCAENKHKFIESTINLILNGKSHESDCYICTKCLLIISINNCHKDIDSNGYCVCGAHVRHVVNSSGCCSVCGVHVSHVNIDNNCFCDYCGVAVRHKDDGNGYCETCKVHMRHEDNGYGFCSGCIGVHLNHKDNGFGNCYACDVHIRHKDYNGDGYCNICGVHVRHVDSGYGYCWCGVHVKHVALAKDLSNTVIGHCKTCFAHIWHKDNGNGYCKTCGVHVSHEDDGYGYCWCGVHIRHVANADGYCETCGVHVSHVKIDNKVYCNVCGVLM